jgi:hypothetical protein
MIINSDERQWSWMDEGLNTFVQFLTEQEFDNNYPSRRGPAHKIVDYMKLPKNRLEPIMTNSENIIEFGPNAYAKPATALNILRETVMGRDLFDFAFKEYCNRWAFKHPRPSDFFRTMEDASGIDLDWYWRAWFYDIEPVDISLDSAWGFQVTTPKVVPVKMDTSNAIQLERIGRRRNGRPVVREDFKHISQLRNKAEGIEFAVDVDTTLRDFYYYYDASKDDYLIQQRNKANTSEIRIRNRFDKLAPLTDEEGSRIDDNYYYQLYLSNKGGCVMPVIIGWEFEDGSTEIDYISAYVWRKNEYNVSKAFVKRKKVVKITLDPMKETADIDTSNNEWPKANEISRFEVFKAKQIEREPNSPMKRLKNKR